MNMFDEARAMSGTLLLCKITQRELAERLGVSQSYVANKIRLLSLSPDMEKKITESEKLSVFCFYQTFLFLASIFIPFSKVFSIFGKKSSRLPFFALVNGL